MFQRLERLYGITKKGFNTGIYHMKELSGVRYKDIDALRELGFLDLVGKSRASVWVWTGDAPSSWLANKLIKYNAKKRVYGLTTADKYRSYYAKSKEPEVIDIPTDDVHSFRTSNSKPDIITIPEIVVHYGKPNEVYISINGNSLPLMTVEVARAYGEILSTLRPLRS